MGDYHFVVEADIQGFFDNLDQDLLVEMLSRRIGDQQRLRLIRKWLRAGVLDTDGKVTQPLTGTPQGGIVSPILANVYLHHALDLWVHEVVKWHTTGEACLIRYADDFVCAFQNEEEARHFFGALEHRLSKFGLQLAAAKSRVIPFSRNGEPGATRFDFLGFEFHWGEGSRRQAAPAAADIAQEASQLAVQLHGMVQTEPSCSVEEAFPIAESQTPWVLQLLWGFRQQRSIAGVLQ